jgi:protein-L-isoaspartate(D-aspartate) O-methyltransferase
MDRQGELSIIRAAYAKQNLAAAGVVDNARLEAAFSATRREDFLGAGPWFILRFRDYRATPDADPVYLYTDNLVGILPERHINNGQPSLHAHLIHRAAPATGEHVVHIGTGTGHYTAILAHLVGPSGRVTGVEYEPALAARAKTNFAAYPNVDIVEGDGTLVSFDTADVIYVNAGCTRPAESWLDRLADGGRLILPMTSDQGFAAKSSPEQMARSGAVFRIERRGKIIWRTGSYRLRSFRAPEAATRCPSALWPKPSPREAGRRSRASISIRRFPRSVAGFVDRGGVSPTADISSVPHRRCCGQDCSGHDPTPISRSWCRDCAARALADHGTSDIIEPKREGGNNHADFRIIAEDFYQDDFSQDNGCCRRRDVWQRRGRQSPGLQAAGPEEADSGRRPVSGPPEGERTLRRLSVLRIPQELRSGRGRHQPDGLVSHLYDVFPARSRRAHLIRVSTLIRRA